MREQIGCLFSESGAEENLIFAEYLSKLLKRPLSIQLSSAIFKKIDQRWFWKNAKDWELALVQVTHSPIRKRGQKDDPASMLSESLPASAMFLCKPRWPFQKILLVLRNSPNDVAAVDWTLRFVQASRASVAILPLIAPAPNFLRISDYPNIIIENLINSNIPLGILLRKFLAKLDQAQVPNKILLKRGTPEWQIAQTLDEGQYDILIIGDERRYILERWGGGNLISTVLRNLDFPVLVAKNGNFDGLMAHA